MYTCRCNLTCKRITSIILINYVGSQGEPFSLAQRAVRHRASSLCRQLPLAHDPHTDKPSLAQFSLVYYPWYSARERDSILGSVAMKAMKVMKVMKVMEPYRMGLRLRLFKDKVWGHNLN